MAETVDQLAQRYGKLPTEILEADIENLAIAKRADLGAYARQGNSGS